MVNQMTPLPSMLLKHRVDWLGLVVACFPVTVPGLCANTGVFLSANAEWKASDCEVHFAEFFKKCMGLESRTAPLRLEKCFSLFHF